MAKTRTDGKEAPVVNPHHDGTVTSLALDSDWVIVGFADAKINREFGGFLFSRVLCVSKKTCETR